jgi:hypothetical protein
VPTVISDGPHDSTMIVVAIARPANNIFFMLKEFKLTIPPFIGGHGSHVHIEISNNYASIKIFR